MMSIITVHPLIKRITVQTILNLDDESFNKGDISKLVAFDQEGNPLQFF